MRRIVRGAVLLAGGAAASVPLIQGCGTDQSSGPRSTARLTAAVLSRRDLPSDFLAAEDQQVFGRLAPGDPDCRRLLDLADLRGLRDVPQTASVFYRPSPGSTLAEHVLAMPAARISTYVRDVRRAAAACPVLSVHGTRLRLHRKALQPPSSASSAGFGIRYTGRTGESYTTHYDIVVVPDGERLLVVVQPALVDRDHPRKGEDTGAVAADALRKLKATPGTTLSP